MVACASSSFPKYSLATELAVTGGRSGRFMVADFPLVAGLPGLRLEEDRRYRGCSEEGVVPLAVLRLEVDLLVVRVGVDCLSPR